MKLLFLDVDGVLNCHECDPEVGCGPIHKEKVQRINGIIRATGCKIVLSSAWRYLIFRGEMNLIGLNWLFKSHGLLDASIIAITRKDSMRVTDAYNGDPKEWPIDNERGLQIHEFVDEWTMCHGPLESFCVVDDLDLGITTHKLPFVQTDGKIGLQYRHVNDIIRLLNIKDTLKK